MRKRFQRHLRGEQVDLLGGLIVRNEGERGIQSSSRIGGAMPLTFVGTHGRSEQL